MSPSSSQRSVTDRRWALIADDLTGACDGAASFAQAGFSASVVLDAARFPDCGSDLLAFSTETRNADAGESVRQVELACDRLITAGRLLLFKKIDSVLRGSPLAEVQAVRRKLGGTEALLTPALPAQGRLVADGRLLLVDPATGRPLEEPREIPAAEGVRVVDASSDDDLRRVATEALAASSLPLFAGSAGLAEALSAELAARLLDQPRPRSVEPDSRPALFLIGTEHPATEAQVAALLRSGAAVPKTLGELAREPLRASTLVRLTWGTPPNLEPLAARLRTGEAGALVLSGGDTARYVLDALGAGEVILGGELEPGTAWGRIRGGAADSIPVVTKSGGFGAARLILPGNLWPGNLRPGNLRLRLATARRLRGRLGVSLFLGDGMAGRSFRAWRIGPARWRLGGRGP